jgi:hypothetical protein
VVITMGCGDTCPVYPGKRCLDGDLADPACKNIQDIRPIREDIDRRVRTLLEQLNSGDLTSSNAVAQGAHRDSTTIQTRRNL